jgi:hypothetical protein
VVGRVGQRRVAGLLVFPGTASRPVDQTGPSRSTPPRVGRFAIVLRAPRFPRRIPVLCRGTLRAGAPPFERPLPLYPRGLRSRSGCSVPLHPHLRPHPPHSQAHPDFTAPRLIRNAFAVHTAPRRPPSGSTLSLSFLPNMPPSTTPGRSETGWFQSCGPDIGLRHVMSGSALPTILLSASRRADFSELHWFAFAAACQVARPCADLTRTLPATGTFTSRLSTSRSPFSPLDITTTVTGPFCRWDSHPLE